jgi:hypothetical protein
MINAAYNEWIGIETTDARLRQPRGHQGQEVQLHAQQHIHQWHTPTVNTLTPYV